MSCEKQLNSDRSQKRGNSNVGHPRNFAFCEVHGPTPIERTITVPSAPGPMGRGRRPAGKRHAGRRASGSPDQPVSRGDSYEFTSNFDRQAANRSALLLGRILDHRGMELRLGREVVVIVLRLDELGLPVGHPRPRVTDRGVGPPALWLEP